MIVEYVVYQCNLFQIYYTIYIVWVWWPIQDDSAICIGIPCLYSLFSSMIKLL